MREEGELLEYQHMITWANLMFCGRLSQREGGGVS